MVASKIKTCGLCKKDYDKLFKPNEKVLGTQLSSVIKSLLDDQQLEFPQKFHICAECALAIIQTEIVLKRLTEALASHKTKNEIDVLKKSLTENVKTATVCEQEEDDENEDEGDIPRIQENEKDITTLDNTLGEWIFNCAHCDYTTKNSKLYKKHMNTIHNVDNPRIYQCMYCTESYQRVNGVQNHIAYVHENKPRPQRQRRKTISLEAPPLMSSTTIGDQLKTETLKANTTSDGNVANDTKPSYEFECDLCKYETPNAKLFKKHLKNKHQVEDERIYKCKQCPSTYVRQFALQNHIAYKHENKPRPKPQRRKSVPPDFELSNTMDNDVLGIVGEVTHREDSNDMKCAHCSYKADNFKKLKNHMVVKHQIDNLNQNGYLLENENNDNGEHSFQKPQQKSRNQMNSNEISTNDWIFRCSHCDFQSTKRKIYKEHIRNQHDLDDENIYKCIHCAGAYKRYNLLQSHVTNKHSIDLTTLSDTSATYLESSQERLNGLSAKKRKIESKVNQSKSSMNPDTNEVQLVKRKKAEGEKTKQKEACVVCGKRFSSVDKLRAHMDKYHGGDEIKNCANCGAQFRSIEKYEAHLFAEKCLDTKSACQYPGCAKRFNKLSKMEQHMREKHPDLIS